MNGPTTLENSQPSFMISSEASPETKELLQKIEAGILDNPELYGAIFEISVIYRDDGVGRLKAENDYLREQASGAEQVPDIRDQWNLFLDKLPGKDSIANYYWFDPVTSEEIRKYAPIQELLAEGEDRRTNSDRKQEIKEEVKIERIRFFIGRAAMVKSLAVQKEPLSKVNKTGVIPA